MNKLNRRLDALRERSESGAALVSSVILMFFVFIVVLTLSATTLRTTVLTADSRSNVSTVATAESGLDAAVYRASTGQCVPTFTDEDFGYSYTVYRSASEEPPSGLDDPSVIAGCPRSGDNYVLVEVNGTDERGRSVDILGTYLWLKSPSGSGQGALVSGGGSMNISTLSIVSEDADLMLAFGDFNCNSTSSIEGDLVVIDGDVAFSNACFIGGSLYASGNVLINNNAVGVGGDVYAVGNYTMSTGATIGGNVYTNGNVQLTSGAIIRGNLQSSGLGNAQIGAVRIDGDVRVAGPINLETGSRIGGSVYSASTSDARAFNTNITGDFVSNGLIRSIQSSVVGGDIQVTRSGVNQLNPTLPVGGDVILAGTYTTFGAGPQVAGTISQNVAGLTPIPAPVFERPEQLLPGYFKWSDYDPEMAEWIAAGYNVITRSGCTYQGNAALINEVNNFTTPTLIDISSCSNVQMFGVVFNVKTDVTFYGNAFNAHSVQINSSTGQPYQFNFITPDKSDNKTPTCSSGQGTTNAYALRMGNNITGKIYSACSVAIGGSSTINGQVYAGTVSWSGGGLTTLNYVPISLPGFPVELSTDSGGVGFEEDALSRPMPQLVDRIETR